MQLYFEELGSLIKDQLRSLVPLNTFEYPLLPMNTGFYTQTFVIQDF